MLENVYKDTLWEFLLLQKNKLKKKKKLLYSVLLC